jgi:hypothetical protein
MLFSFFSLIAYGSGSRRYQWGSLRIRIQNMGLLLSFKTFRSFYRPLRNYERRFLTWSSSLPSPLFRALGEAASPVPCVPSNVVDPDVVGSGTFWPGRVRIWSIRNFLARSGPDMETMCWQHCLSGESYSKNSDPAYVPCYAGSGSYM